MGIQQRAVHLPAEGRGERVHAGQEGGLCAEKVPEGRAPGLVVGARIIVDKAGRRAARPRERVADALAGQRVRVGGGVAEEEPVVASAGEVEEGRVAHRGDERRVARDGTRGRVFAGEKVVQAGEEGARTEIAHT